jgi:hypothetical protein
MRSATGRGLGRLSILAALLAGLGCGSGEDPLARASGAPMAAPPRPAAGGEAEANAAPEISAVWLEPDPPAFGERVRAMVRARDPEGDPLRLDFTWTVGGTRAAVREAELPLTLGRKGDEVRVAVVASDGRTQSPAFEAATTIRNRPPRLKGARLEPSGALPPGGEVNVQAEAEDPDGDAVTLEYAWVVNGATTQETGASLFTAGLQRGDRILARVTASDGDDTGGSWISPELVVGNTPPEVVSQPTPPGEDGVFRYAVRAEDPDGDRVLRFRLGAAPEGMSVDPRRGLVEWKPAAEQAGRHRVELVVADAQGGETVHAFELVVDPPAAAGGAASDETAASDENAAQTGASTTAGEAAAQAASPAPETPPAKAARPETAP